MTARLAKVLVPLLLVGCASFGVPQQYDNCYRFEEGFSTKDEGILADDVISIVKQGYTGIRKLGTDSIQLWG